MAVDRERWSICSRSAMAMLKDGGKARTPTHINAASTGTEPLAIGTYAIGEVRENARRVRSWKVPVAPEFVLASRGSSV